MQQIEPYRHDHRWVFDDPAVGLVKEPLVWGIDDMLDKQVGNRKRCRIIFSDQPFPGHRTTLEWRRKWLTGDVYYSPQWNMEGWLCPALLHYFKRAPRMIYIRVVC